MPVQEADGQALPQLKGQARLWRLPTGQRLQQVLRQRCKEPLLVSGDSHVAGGRLVVCGGCMDCAPRQVQQVTHLPGNPMDSIQTSHFGCFMIQ